MFPSPWLPAILGAMHPAPPLSVPDSDADSTQCSLHLCCLSLSVSLCLDSWPLLYFDTCWIGGFLILVFKTSRASAPNSGSSVFSYTGSQLTVQNAHNGHGHLKLMFTTENDMFNLNSSGAKSNSYCRSMAVRNLAQVHCRFLQDRVHGGWIRLLL